MDLLNTKIGQRCGSSNGGLNWCDLIYLKAVRDLVGMNNSCDIDGFAEGGLTMLIS